MILEEMCTMFFKGVSFVAVLISDLFFLFLKALTSYLIKFLFRECATLTDRYLCIT